MQTFTHAGLPIGRAKGCKSSTTALIHKRLHMFIYCPFGFVITGGRKKINIHLFEKSIIFYYY